MHFIKSIEITNFRSILHTVINCSEYNLFCGLNDVGKSNVLKALNLFFNDETDFQTPLIFAKDYNKIALALAQKSRKQKQLIKIKLKLNIPPGYKSLSGLRHITVEKTIDRYGKSDIKYMDDNGKSKSAQARLLNQIKYVYIPALKGENVIQYLLGLLGEYQLVDKKTIDDMNSQINTATKDLSDLLHKSNIATEARFGLPTLLRDFWQKLSVNTVYEQFNELDAIEGTAKDKERKLNPANYQIPLVLRGDGIKSKYIPPLLQWLQNNNHYNTYVWGIDEPENSLEFKALEHLSSLFCNEYALSTQIFGTTHSMAFINPADDSTVKPTVFRCMKTNQGATSIKTIEDLLKESNKQEILEELGALEVQHHIIQEFREKMREAEDAKKASEETICELNGKVTSLTKPLIITEGKTDWKHLKAALVKLKANGQFSDIPDFEFYEYEDTPQMGDKQLEVICNSYACTNNKRKIICLLS